MKYTVNVLQSFFYVINIVWSAFLILDSYKQETNLLTAFITVFILLGSMILNDLLKKESPKDLL